MPATRERMPSSTKRTIIASVKGMAPKMADMNSSWMKRKAQPSSVVASASSSACSVITPM